MIGWLRRELALRRASALKRREDAYATAADQGMRAGRRRALCGVVGPDGVPTLPERRRTIELTYEWLRRAHGVIATVKAPWLVLHAPEGHIRYEAIYEDFERFRVRFLRDD